MKTFYGATYIKAINLAIAKVYHPIKIEYYKICQEKEEKNKDVLYGIEIIKKIYKNKKIQIEKEKTLSITSSEEKIEKILELLKNNQVTPIALKDIVADLI